MDTETYDQISLSHEQLKWELNFLKENMNIKIMSYQGEILGINLPKSVDLKVIETDASVKGNTAQGALKNAKVETGLNVMVPLLSTKAIFFPLIQMMENTFHARATND